MLLKGKKAIVTGGARGIGKEIVTAYLKNGATVYFIDIAPSEFMAEYEALAKENGVGVFFRQASVSDEEQITATLKAILEESGGIDILVNNAGITRDNILFRMTSKDWLDVININLTSAFYTCKVVSRAMLNQKSGCIINMASIVGVAGNPGQGNYSASKAGLIGLTKSLSQELGSRGVRVNAVAPGFIETPMTDKLPEAAKQEFLRKIPLGRGGKPEEVASVCVFLASDLSSYVTGQVIQVTGGMPG